MNSGHNAHSKWAESRAKGPVLPAGMRVTVTCLRAGGAKHRSEPVQGYIASDDGINHPAMAFVSRSQVRLFRDAERQTGDLLKVLYDAQLLQWDSRGIFLQGWEIDIDGENRQIQRVQIWCICPLN